MNRKAWWGSMMELRNRSGREHVVVLLCVLAACSAPGEANDGDGGRDRQAPVRTVNVEVRTVQREPFVEHVTVTGEVEADRNITVVAEEGGVIREVLVEKGTRVAADRPIARIDDRLLRAQYDQARAHADLAVETWERQRRLWEEDSIGTELAYLNAKYGADIAEANARALAIRLERTVIRAPIGGVVDARFIELGSTVSAGTAVARIVDANPVKVMAGIPERFAREMRAGSDATVTFDHVPDQTFTGRVVFVGTVVDEQSRTFPIEITIPNAGGALKPGMVAKVSTPRRRLEEAILVPRDAVIRSSTGYIVYLAQKQGDRIVAEARAVALGGGNEGRVVIESGLESGDRVIIVGQHQVAAGDVLEIVQDGGTSG